MKVFTIYCFIFLLSTNNNGYFISRDVYVGEIKISSCLSYEIGHLELSRFNAKSQKVRKSIRSKIFRKKKSKVEKNVIYSLYDRGLLVRSLTLNLPDQILDESFTYFRDSTFSCEWWINTKDSVFIFETRSHPIFKN